MATIAIGISPKAGGGVTTQVPVNSLYEDGVPPEEGDQVSFSVEGKVQSVDGNMATVAIDSINGEPVGEESSESSKQEAAEGQTPATSGAGGGQTPVAANGPRSASGLDPSIAPMGTGLARNRLDRTGTVALRNRLMKGSKGQALPF